MSTPVPLVPLQVMVKPEDGQIVDVGPYTHAVIWAGESTPSRVRYCNSCGGAFQRPGLTTKHVAYRPVEDAATYVDGTPCWACASCGAVQGPRVEGL